MPVIEYYRTLNKVAEVSKGLYLPFSGAQSRMYRSIAQQRSRKSIVWRALLLPTYFLELYPEYLLRHRNTSHFCLQLQALLEYRQCALKSGT
jgi:hypothetical protein